MERVDYVRLRLEGSREQREEDAAGWSEVANQIGERYSLQRKFYDTYMLQDRITRQWSTYWNIWGIAADVFYHQLDVGHFNKVKRLDFRIDLENDQLDVEEVGLWGIRNAKSRGYSYTLHNGRVKSKRNGRDTGGPSLHVGAQDTDKRISLYKRGHEAPGVEAQISKKLLSDTLKHAYDVSLEGSQDFHAQVKVELKRLLEQLCIDRLLHPLSAFTGDSPIYAQSRVNNVPEAVYEQVSLFWELLDLNEREAMINRLTHDIGVYRAIKEEGEPIVPDDVPDDYYDSETYLPEADELDNRSYDDYSQGNW